MAQATAAQPVRIAGVYPDFAPRSPLGAFARSFALVQETMPFGPESRIESASTSFGISLGFRILDLRQLHYYLTAESAETAESFGDTVSPSLRPRRSLRLDSTAVAVEARKKACWGPWIVQYPHLGFRISLGFRI